MATTCGVLRLDKSFHNLSSYVLDEGDVQLVRILILDWDRIYDLKI